MTIDKATKLRDLTLTLLLIERDQVAEQLALTSCKQEKAAHYHVRGKRIKRLSISGHSYSSREAQS
jgi:hypothetical protein